jgi:hypothetical protein
LVFPRNPLQSSTQLDPRSFHWTPQLDPWSYHWTLSRWSFNPKNKNDYVLMFLKKSDWEDEEDEVSFRFLCAPKQLLLHCFNLVFNCFSLVNSFLHCCQKYFLYTRTEAVSWLKQTYVLMHDVMYRFIL